jgi:hypothetical protein
MRLSHSVAGVLLLGLSLSLMIESPAAAAGAVTVTPTAGLLDGQTVTIDATGFDPFVDVAFCQALMLGSPGPEDCGRPFSTGTTDESGDFSTPYVVRRFMFSSQLERTVDCADPSANCVIGFAQANNVGGTAVLTPIAFEPSPPPTRPDGRIKRRSDGVVSWDDVYNETGAGQTRSHAIASDGRWTFALQAQNDSAVVDDIHISGEAFTQDFTIRYFLGYYDITSSVTSSEGFTLAHMAPGAVQLFAIQFTANAGAPAGATVAASVFSRSGTNPQMFDRVIVSAYVPSTS